MTHDELDRLAELVADKLADRLRSTPGRGLKLVDARTASAVLGVGRHWLYEHAAELPGTVRLGTGPRARIRFDLARLTADPADPLPAPDEPTRPTTRPRKRTRQEAQEVVRSRPFDDEHSEVAA